MGAGKGASVYYHSLEKFHVKKYSCIKCPCLKIFGRYDNLTPVRLCNMYVENLLSGSLSKYEKIKKKLKFPKVRYCIITL